MDRHLLGKKGEDLAANYLEVHGYSIVERNFRHGRGEIDIICVIKNDLIIVEVKSVRKIEFGRGEERISAKKQKKIIKTTYAFLASNQNFAEMGVRFDVVVVNFFKYPAQLKHYEESFWQLH